MKTYEKPEIELISLIAMEEITNQDADTEIGDVGFESNFFG